MGVQGSKPPPRCAGPAARCFAGLALGAARVSPTGTPLPRILHRRLRREEVCPSPGGRLIIVGDVHGCADELQRLLSHTGFVRGTDTLILVGDLVNKGPRSGDVLRLARELGALCVRGNHDDELLEAWHRVGHFAESLDRYANNALHQVSAADVQWVQEWPLSISLPWLPLVVVHAGLVPDVPLEEQTFRNLLWMRDLEAAPGGGWRGLQKAAVGSVAWAGVWAGPAHVVFGHDAKRRLQQHPWATGLDTGCCYGNQLTALVLDPDDLAKRSIAQVSAEKMYSVPDDKRMGA